MSRSSKRDGLGILGFGAVACAACCAGPILGFLAAIGAGTVAGVAVFGVAGLAIAALAVPLVIRRRRQRAASCDVDQVAIEIGSKPAS